MSDSVPVANAPVTFGAFEITVGRDPNVPDPLAVLDAIYHAGYAGTDLGPLGFFGSTSELPARLAERELSLSGGFVEFHFTRPEDMEPALQEFESVLDLFDAWRSASSSNHQPRPTIADTGAEHRRLNPGQAHLNRDLGLSEGGWQIMASQVKRVVDRCRERGYDPTFHPETGTYIEAPWEIEKLLSLTDVGLCLDTGHLLLGGGDPVAAVRDWAPRINHMHLKDARVDLIRQIATHDGTVEDIWRRRAFCALGQGDLDIDGVLQGLKAMSYSGWIVIEQDRLPEASEPVGVIEREQAANREFLRDHGF